MHTSNHLLALLQTLNLASLPSIHKNYSYGIAHSLLIAKFNEYDSLAFLFLSQFSPFEYKASPSIQSLKPKGSAIISLNYLHLILPWLSRLNSSHQQVQAFYLYTCNSFTFLLPHYNQPGASHIISHRSLTISSSFFTAAKMIFPNCKLSLKWNINSVSWPMRPIWWDYKGDIYPSPPLCTIHRKERTFSLKEGNYGNIPVLSQQLPPPLSSLVSLPSAER